MQDTERYGFTLAKTSGFTPNYGFVKNAFEDNDLLKAEHSLKQGEVLDNLNVK